MAKNKNITNEREQRIIDQLRANPQMFDRIESILSMANEPFDGIIRTADEIEALLIEELRKLGNETLGNWGSHVENQVAEKTKQSGKKIHQREKKR